MLNHKPHRRVLRADDLSVGQHVMIYRGRVFGCRQTWQGPHRGEAYETLKGLPLTIQSIALPYVFMQVGTVANHTIVDLRNADLCRCPADYVDAWRKAAGLPPLTQAGEPCQFDGTATVQVFEDPQRTEQGGQQHGQA